MSLGTNSERLQCWFTVPVQHGELGIRLSQKSWQQEERQGFVTGHIRALARATLLNSCLLVGNEESSSLGRASMAHPIHAVFPSALSSWKLKVSTNQ